MIYEIKIGNDVFYVNQDGKFIQVENSFLYTS